MKTCPTCHRGYEDESLKFCLEDGSSLVAGPPPTRAASAGDATLVLPGSGADQPPTVRLTQPSTGQPTMTSVGSMGPPMPVPSGATYSGEARRSGALLWVVGALIIGIAAVAVALIVTRNRSQDSNSNVQANAAASPEATIMVEVATPSESGAANRAVDQSRLEQPAKLKETPAKKDAVEKPVSTPAPAPAEKPRGPISGGVMNGKAAHLVTPPYPAIARSAHASGQVTVQVLIDEQGNVISAHAVSGHPLLQPSAVAAARASKFTPTVLGGQPVKVNGSIIYNFVAQ